MKIKMKNYNELLDKNMTLGEFFEKTGYESDDYSPIQPEKIQKDFRQEVYTMQVEGNKYVHIYIIFTDTFEVYKELYQDYYITNSYKKMNIKVIKIEEWEKQ